MKYVLGIPFLNRSDLLTRAVGSIKQLWSEAFIVDNSESGLDSSQWPLEIVRPSVPLTFSQTMNLMQRLADEQSCDALLYMHNDAEAGDGTAERFVDIVREAVATERRWGVAFTHYDTLSAFSMPMAHEVGRWDTNLPQYFSDNDYYRRIRLAGYEVIETGLEVIHHASSTINSDSRLLFLNSVTFPLYEQYYRRKWGGPPGSEVYDRPFNGAI